MGKIPLGYYNTKTTPVFEYKPYKETNKANIVSECFLACKENAAEYCTFTDLHGLKYVAHRSRHILQRWFWFLAFGISTTFAVFLIVRMYMDYANRPMITVFEYTPKRLHEIPFPAVTFCNLKNAFSERAFKQYTREVFQKAPNATLNETELKTLAKVADIVDTCRTYNKYTTTDKLEVASKRLNKYFHANKQKLKAYENPVQTLVDESQKCQDYIKACTWKQSYIDCKKAFTGVVTDEGYCCTFNSMPVSSYVKNSVATVENSMHVGTNVWSGLEKSKSLTFDEILTTDRMNILWNATLKQTSRGLYNGLAVHLDHTVDKSICSRITRNGTSVYVHTQLDFPMSGAGNQAANIVYGDSEVINVKPDITLSDGNIQFLRRSKRKCYYGNEYKLRWYKHYTLANCIEEYSVKSIIGACGCVPKYVLFGVPSKPVCNSSMDYCVNANGRWKLDWNGFMDTDWCLPTCTEIHYHTNVETLKLETETSVGYSVVRVHMDVDSVYPKLRKESITIIQLLSNAGGLLGLFMGFSVLSVLEILYYCLMCLRRRRREYPLSQQQTNKKCTCRFPSMSNMSRKTSQCSVVPIVLLP